MAETYLDGVPSILEKIRSEQMDMILRAAEIVAEAVYSVKWVHMFGTGHSHMMADESSGRAGDSRHSTR